MLMEGGGGGIVAGNVPSSVMATAVVSGSECAYNQGSSMTNDNNVAAESTDITKTNLAMFENDKGVPTINGSEDAAYSSSTGVVCTSSSGKSSVVMDTSGDGITTIKCATNNYTTATSDPGYPVIGSPAADLMVVNTNGFNPLQHAALRGNPG